MRTIRRLGPVAGVLLLLLVTSRPAAAQVSVSAADIQRLQDQVYQAASDISQLRSRDAALATDLQAQLDDLRDEVTYLKVKLRRDGSVADSEFSDLRDRIAAVRARARGEAPSAAPDARTGSSTWSGGTASSGQTTSGGTTDRPAPTSAARKNEVPANQEIDVRLERELSSATAQVEDRFTATTVVDLYQGNDVLIPAGSSLRGVVSSVDPATRTDRKGSLTVAFDQITIRGRSYPTHLTVTQALESEGIRGEIGKIGAGSAVGAIIGGILGGGKGALLGVLIGGGGTIAATPGKDVTIPAGTILRVKFDRPLLVK